MAEQNSNFVIQVTTDIAGSLDKRIIEITITLQQTSEYREHEIVVGS